MGDAGSHTTIQTGDALTLEGAQVHGSGVDMAADSLHIQSQQDTATYKSQQQGMSGQITVGYGASGSASYSHSKIDADHASVTEQSGILAGDNGYRINVQGNTDLKGGIITSTQAAETAGSNSLSTGTLTASDMANHSTYQGNSIDISGGGSVAGGRNWRAWG